MSNKLQSALTRLEVGLTKQSTPDCEWYEGIELDALDELKAVLGPVGEHYCDRNGEKPKEGHCMMPDNYTTTFVVTLRTQYALSHLAVKPLLEQRHEVTEITKVGSLCVVR